jgi:hypothetical protein
VAVSYDPKVKTLARLIGAPVIEGASPPELAKLHPSILSATPPETGALEAMKSKAQRNAELAVQLGT